MFRLILLISMVLLLSGCFGKDTITYVNRYVVLSPPQSLLEEFTVPVPPSLSNYKDYPMCGGSGVMVETYLSAVTDIKDGWVSEYELTAKHNSNMRAIAEWVKQQEASYSSSGTPLNK